MDQRTSDNKSAIRSTNSPIQHDCIKHVEIHHHFIKEQLNTNLIGTLYVG